MRGRGHACAGCVHGRGMHAQGACGQGDMFAGGICIAGGCAWQGECMVGACMAGGICGRGHACLGRMHGTHAPPPPHPQADRMTDACKNITLPQTLFAGGKNVWT